MGNLKIYNLKIRNFKLRNLNIWNLTIRNSEFENSELKIEKLMVFFWAGVRFKNFFETYLCRQSTLVLEEQP